MRDIHLTGATLVRGPDNLTVCTGELTETAGAKQWRDLGFAKWGYPYGLASTDHTSCVRSERCEATCLPGDSSGSQYGDRLVGISTGFADCQ